MQRCQMSLIIFTFLAINIFANGQTLPPDDATSNNTSTPSDLIVSGPHIRRKRDFGGREPINYPKVWDAVIGPKSLVSQACQTFSNINFQFLGYTMIAIAYNVNEPRKDPDKVRQKYLDQFFGPTPLSQSAFRVIRNPLFSFVFRIFYNLIFINKNTTEVLHDIELSTIRDTILSEPWLHSRIFRDVCSFYFTTIGWATYYIVYKFSVKMPIIAGRKKRSISKEITGEEILKTLDAVYKKILLNLDQKKKFTYQEEERILMESYNSFSDLSDYFFTRNETSKAFGEYQYYLSFGGDQYMNIPLAIDSAFGTRGLVNQCGNTMSTVPFELAGYTAMGFMYNRYYRTMIKESEPRKFLDTFLGPSVVASSMLSVVRNGVFSLATRIALGLYLPLTRQRTIYILQTLSFKVIKNAVFTENYLHVRIFRHIVEAACNFLGSSTYYAVYTYKRIYLDPPKKKDEESSGNSTAKANSTKTTTKATTTTTLMPIETTMLPLVIEDTTYPPEITTQNPYDVNNEKNYSNDPVEYNIKRINNYEPAMENDEHYINYKYQTPEQQYGQDQLFEKDGSVKAINKWNQFKTPEVSFQHKTNQQYGFPVSGYNLVRYKSNRPTIF